MKMIDTETGHEMVEVSGHDKKEYASKGVAGTGLGLGIAGTALWLLSGGLGGGLFGNRAGLAGAAAIGAEGIAEKRISVNLSMICGLWLLMVRPLVLMTVRRLMLKCLVFIRVK